MPLASSSEAPVIRPGPMISASFGRSGCLIRSAEGRLIIWGFLLPRRLARRELLLNLKMAADVPAYREHID
jgi:hypothetical protein